MAGASDNDPTTVGAVSAVGATTGYRLAWLAVLVFPMLAAVQLIAAQLGSVTGSDLQALATRRYGRRWAGALLASVVAVNVLTIAADLEAGAAALGLLLPVGWRWFVVPLAALLVVLLAADTYGQVERVLKYVLVGLFVYVAAAAVSHPRWASVLSGTLVPRLSFDGPTVTAATALVGTTVTSYVYIWQTIGSAERRGPADRVSAARWDAVVGSGVLAVVVWSILVAAGRLHGRGASIQTAADAARALTPLVGGAARYLFGAGLLASAVLALPVLTATTAYVVGSQFAWRRGLSVGVRRAPAFYAVIVVAVALGATVTLAGVPAVTILVAASLAGGVGAPVGLFFLVRMASDPAVMGERTVARPLAAAGWLLILLTLGLVVAFLIQHLP